MEKKKHIRMKAGQNENVQEEEKWKEKKEREEQWWMGGQRGGEKTEKINRKKRVVLSWSKRNDTDLKKSQNRGKTEEQKVKAERVLGDAEGKYKGRETIETKDEKKR